MPLFQLNKTKIAICFFIVPLLVIFFFSSIKLAKSMYSNIEDKPVIIWENQLCSLKEKNSCNINLDSINLTLNLHPKILTYKHPINIEVELTGSNCSEITAEFIGKTMSMGLFPFKLQLSDYTEKKYKFSGIGRIVFCTTDPNMQWLLQLRITSSDKIHQIAIELIN